MKQPRRYLTIIQDERGYPGPKDELDLAPPRGPKPPNIVAVIKVDDHDEVVKKLQEEIERLKDELRQHPGHH